MIRENTFNSAWWGAPVGLVTSPAFFDLDRASQQAALAPYAWAEFRAPLESAPPLSAVQRAGFVQFDSQIEFRIGLQHVPSSASLDGLEVRFADAQPFRVDPAAAALFQHERVLHLPGITPQRVNERYAQWANELIAHHAGWCLEVRCESAVQGWFLAETDAKGLHLTLAMLHREARIAGMYLYQKGLLAYAKRGARVGHAGFSIRNVAVHNIYARLGALFLPPVGYWLWVREGG